MHSGPVTETVLSRQSLSSTSAVSLVHWPIVLMVNLLFTENFSSLSSRWCFPLCPVQWVIHIHMSAGGWTKFLHLAYFIIYVNGYSFNTIFAVTSMTVRKHFIKCTVSSLHPLCIAQYHDTAFFSVDLAPGVPVNLNIWCNFQHIQKPMTNLNISNSPFTKDVNEISYDM